MAKVYNEEFKKHLVEEYIQGKSYPTLEKEYGVAKSTLSGWVKKYSEECLISQPHTTNSTVFYPKEIQQFHKRIAELEKEPLFLKRSLQPTKLALHSSQGKQISGISLH